MRVLITGAAGFVGPYVANALRMIHGADLAIIPTSKTAANHPTLGLVEPLDVTDHRAVEAAIDHHRPSHIIHLAGIAAPIDASNDPDQAWRVHVQGTLNLARAVLKKAPDCCLINAGTGLVYGTSANRGLPLDETAILSPIDDYGVTKAAADLALGALVHQGLRCVRIRAFNHTGAGQSGAFVIPSFAIQIARIEAGQMEPTIRVGNLDAQRDFLDVRDVATAYALAATKSTLAGGGAILNIASGKGRRVGDLLDILLSFSRVDIKIEQDSARMRPSDLPHVVGNPEQAWQLLGWQSKYAIEQTLADVLADCRQRVSVEPR